MQAVILAAGEGRRMRPLTLERPKPLIEVGGMPLIEHVLGALPSVVDEVIIVIGYKGTMIRRRFGPRHGDRRLTYVRQRELGGTAAALELVQHLLHDRFLVMCADDIHGATALEEAARYPLAVLAARHPEPQKFGVIEVNGDGTVRSLIEKPEVPVSDLVSTGALVLDGRIFDYPAPAHANGERYVTDPLSALAFDAPVHIVLQEAWIPIGYPEDIERAESLIAARAS